MYSELKKEYNELLKKSKAKHFSNRIMASNNKSKTTWKIVHDLTGNKEKQHAIVPEGDLQSLSEGF